jgi:AcrR family transcriptional regulator
MARASTSEERKTLAQRSEEAVEGLRKATLEIIAEQGMKGLTLGAVGTRAGVSRGLPNYHFGSKAALIRHVLDAMLAQRLTRYGERPDLVGAEAILANLDDVVGFFRDNPIEQRGFAILMSEGLVDPDPQVRQRIADYNRAIRELIAARFDAILAQQRPPTDVDAETLASLYIACLRGITLQWVAEPDLAPIERAIQALKMLVSAALGAGATASTPLAPPPGASKPRTSR